MKLTPVQLLRINEAIRHASEALREIKLRKLTPREVKYMKILEDGVDHLEVVRNAVL